MSSSSRRFRATRRVGDRIAENTSYQRGRIAPLHARADRAAKRSAGYVGIRMWVTRRFRRVDRATTHHREETARRSLPALLLPAACERVGGPPRDARPGQEKASARQPMNRRPEHLVTMRDRGALRWRDPDSNRDTTIFSQARSRSPRTGIPGKHAVPVERPRQTHVRNLRSFTGNSGVDGHSRPKRPHVPIGY